MKKRQGNYITIGDGIRYTDETIHVTRGTVHVGAGVTVLGPDGKKWRPQKRVVMRKPVPQKQVLQPAQS